MSVNGSGKTAVYPGSFDPITNGHEDIVRRALRFIDRVIIAVAHRATQPKKGLFAVEERVAMIGEVFADEPRVRVDAFDGLLVEYARSNDAPFLIRGLRAVSDFDYEFQMALMNRELWEGIETIFLAPDAHNSFLSASLVREVASLGGDVSPFVAAPIERRLREKFA